MTPAKKREAIDYLRWAYQTEPQRLAWYLQGAFNWSTTPPDYSFWWDLHEELKVDFVVAGIKLALILDEWEKELNDAR